MMRQQIRRVLRSPEGPLLIRVLLLAQSMKHRGITADTCVREIGTPSKFGYSKYETEDEVRKFYSGFLHHKAYSGHLIHVGCGRYKITEKGEKHLDDYYYAIKEARASALRKAEEAVGDGVIRA